MKKLELKQMEAITAGKFTLQELDDFLGAAGCVLIGTGWGAIFGALSCARWIHSMS
jgi:hypothetical protein